MQNPNLFAQFLHVLALIGVFGSTHLWGQSAAAKKPAA
jgi:hypothetical protein